MCTSTFFCTFGNCLPSFPTNQGLPFPRAREDKRCMLTNAELGKCSRSAARMAVKTATFSA